MARFEVGQKVTVPGRQNPCEVVAVEDERPVCCLRGANGYLFTASFAVCSPVPPPDPRDAELELLRPVAEAVERYAAVCADGDDPLRHQAFVAMTTRAEAWREDRTEGDGT